MSERQDQELMRLLREADLPLDTDTERLVAGEFAREEAQLRRLFARHLPPGSEVTTTSPRLGGARAKGRGREWLWGCVAALLALAIGWRLLPASPPPPASVSSPSGGGSLESREMTSADAGVGRNMAPQRAVLNRGDAEAVDDIADLDDPWGIIVTTTFDGDWDVEEEALGG